MKECLPRGIIHGTREKRKEPQRVSTTDKGQDINLQLNDLKPYCERRGWTYTEYVDNGVSGAKEKRPAFDLLMKDAQKKQFDVIVAWKLDRFSRSLQHLITTLNDLKYSFWRRCGGS